MTDPMENGNSWAIQTEDISQMTSFELPRTETEPLSLESADLRHKLRRSRGGRESNSHESSSNDYSPMKSPSRPRRHRNQQGNDMSGPNYRRERDGLSPLRSPLTSEQRSSRVNPSSRRRSIKDDDKAKKENELPKSVSPSKKNRTTRPQNALSDDVEE